MRFACTIDCVMAQKWLATAAVAICWYKSVCCSCASLPVWLRTPDAALLQEYIARKLGAAGRTVAELAAAYERQQAAHQAADATAAGEAALAADIRHPGAGSAAGASTAGAAPLSAAKSARGRSAEAAAAASAPADAVGATTALPGARHPSPATRGGGSPGQPWQQESGSALDSEASEADSELYSPPEEPRLTADRQEAVSQRALQLAVRKYEGGKLGRAELLRKAQRAARQRG